MENDAGVLFVVTGKVYTEAALQAAASVVKSNPWLKIAIFTDQDVSQHVSVVPLHFVGKIEAGESRRKHEFVAHTPFAKTLYLDSDTRVTSDLHDLFRLLEKFEMAGAHIRYRDRPKRMIMNKLSIPQVFPQINCGVLLYKKCPNVDQLFKLWCELYREGGFARDQIPFREALWLSDIKFYVFGPEYNKRFIPFSGLGGEPAPIILHIKGFNSRSAIVRAAIHFLLLPTRFRIWRRARKVK